MKSPTCLLDDDEVVEEHLLKRLFDPTHPGLAQDTGSVLRESAIA
jgi:hypothetical protein